jgi:hypothetical protein
LMVMRLLLIRAVADRKSFHSRAASSYIRLGR